jgi:hypothetical protein
LKQAFSSIASGGGWRRLWFGEDEREGKQRRAHGTCNITASLFNLLSAAGRCRHGKIVPKFGIQRLPFFAGAALKVIRVGPGMNEMSLISTTPLVSISISRVEKASTPGGSGFSNACRQESVPLEDVLQGKLN